jgi:endo-1,4-beta-xylanase
MPSAGAGGSGGTAGAAGGGAGGKAGAAGAPSCPSPATLKAAGTCTGRLVGVALNADHLAETDYATRARQFNYVTPENEMKWDATEPTRNTFTFTRGDQIVDFAVANGMQVKGHTLVWHSQLPAWLTSLTSASEVRAAMLNHIRALMEHYRGKVIVWDVVNEVFDDNGVLRDSVFNVTIGRTFIEEAFQAARDTDANVKLYYNDFDIENAGAKADAAYAMLADFKARGIPIDGVGMQMHTRSTSEDPTLPEFVANLERILALGLEVTLSEMDVRVCDGGSLTEQAARYHDIVAACVARPGCGAVTVWGITDKYSWLNDRDPLTCVTLLPPRGLLWDDSYAQKPAYAGLLDALAGR